MNEANVFQIEQAPVINQIPNRIERFVSAGRRAFLVAGIAASAIGGMSEAEPTEAYAAGTDRATFTCPTADPLLSDYCVGQEDTTTVKITDFNNYDPNVTGSDPGYQNVHFGIPNGDSLDKLYVRYGRRETTTRASGVAPTCNVITNGTPSVQEACATWDSTHNPDGTVKTTTTTGGDTTGGGTTTPTVNTALRNRYIACTTEDVRYTRDTNNTNPYNYKIKARAGGLFTTSAFFQNLRNSEPACNDINTDRNVTLQYYQKGRDGNIHALTKRQNVINPSNDNNLWHTRKTQAIRRVICGSRNPVFGVFKLSSTASGDFTNDNVANPEKITSKTRTLRTNNFRVC